MATANQPIELNLTNELRPIPSYPASTWQSRRWQQRYLLEQLDQIWFLPVWFWPDFWAATEAGRSPDQSNWRKQALPPYTGAVKSSPSSADQYTVKTPSSSGQWLSVEISTPGVLPLVELQGSGQLALPNGNSSSPHPVTTTISTSDGALRLDGASIRLPAGLPAVLGISHQPAAPGQPRWQINLALHHPERGPFFEFQGIFRLPQERHPGLVDQLQASDSIRQVLELL